MPVRTVVHLSDIHFGRADPSVVAEVIRSVHEIRPDVVAVSGDLTQRARKHEYQQARDFLDALPKPSIVVPGNHDIPLHNLYHRFYRALDNYRHYITEDLEPFYRDETMAILGLNTARSLTVKGGRINEEQISRIAEHFAALPEELTKILVTHHPFDLPSTFERRDLVGRAPAAMLSLARCGVDLLLAGHFHVSHSGPTSVRYNTGGYSAVFVQAGTACSTRERGERNSFNVIRADSDTIEVEVLSTEPDNVFRSASVETFQYTPVGWIRRPAPPA